MLGKTHLSFSLFVSLFAINEFNISNKILFVIFCMLFSIIPDIDYAKSKVGKKTWPLSSIIEFFLKHRGIFHSLLIPVLLYALFYYLGFKEVGVAIFVGYASHLLLDMFTKEGVMPFYPISFRITGYFKSGGLADRFLFYVFILMSLFVIV